MFHTAGDKQPTPSEVLERGGGVHVSNMYLRRVFELCMTRVHIIWSVVFISTLWWDLVKYIDIFNSLIVMLYFDCLFWGWVLAQRFLYFLDWSGCWLYLDSSFLCWSSLSSWLFPSFPISPFAERYVQVVFDSNNYAHWHFNYILRIYYQNILFIKVLYAYTPCNTLFEESFIFLWITVTF